MPRRSHRVAQVSALLLALPPLAALLLPQGADAGRRRGNVQKLEPVGHQLFASPQSNPIALSPAGDRVYVAATTSDRLDVINTSNNNVFARIEVGVDPASVAVRPDGLEVWVANHVSDSVSVVDADPASATFH